MRTLTDKAIQFRTFPVVPKKRVKFDPNEVVEFIEYGSDNPVFQCRGGYFTHNSYRLLDYFVSHWSEVAQWIFKTKFGEKYPENLFGNNIAKLYELTPILKMTGNGNAPDLEHDLLGLCQGMGDFVVIDEVSDYTMRSHPSLSGLSSIDLNRIIEKTSQVQLKIQYSLRSIKTFKKTQAFGYIPWSNLKDDRPWSKLFDYRVVNEIKGADGRILERIYKFGFKNPLGLAMIHNTICGGHWTMNSSLYGLSADAQLLYRYLIITGARRKNNTPEYLAHRLAWREKQKSRIIQRLKILFEEIRSAGLIKDFTAVENNHHGCLFSYSLSPTKKK